MDTDQQPELDVHVGVGAEPIVMRPDKVYYGDERLKRHVQAMHGDLIDYRIMRRLTRIKMMPGTAKLVAYLIDSSRNRLI